MNIFSRSLVVLLGWTPLLGMTGCSEKLPDGMPKLIKVTLTLTQEGQPLSEANVSLFSEDPSFKWTIGGTTDAKGAVVLKTHGQYIGAPEGTYKICVKKFMREGALQTLDNPGAPPPKDYNLVESRYGQQNNTPLSIVIKTGNKYEPFDVGQAVKEQLKAPGM